MVGRPDVNDVPGGDTIQMLETKASLENLGVIVALATADALPEILDFDIVHVFNWEQLGAVVRRRNGAGGKDRPVVVSTIFWHHTGHWFCDAMRRRTVWQITDKCFGRRRAVGVYEKWQAVKFRWGNRGRGLRKDLARADRLLPNSHSEVSHLQSVLGSRGVPRARVTVVPNGVRRELFDPAPAPDKSFRQEYGLTGFVLEVARIQSAKNQLGLIEALFDLPVPIVFVGQASPYETAYVDRCRRRAEARGNVYFVGPKSPRELAGIYAQAAVHVLPSYRETPGLASLEAGAAGCRVVSTEVGCAREYFGDLAWYCDPRDTSSIRKAVLQALESPRSDELRRRILDRYTWDAAASATLDVYRSVLESKSRKRIEPWLGRAVFQGDDGQSG